MLGNLITLMKADRPNPSSSGKRDRILAAASTGLLLRVSAEMESTLGLSALVHSLAVLE